jgi:hypothetical protein
MKIAIAIDKQPEKKEKESTRIIFLLDRSTSMNSMREEAVSGFNQYLESQQKIEGKAKISLFFFDSKYQPVYESVDVKKAPQIICGTMGAHTAKGPYVYQPQGMTSLYDYIHDTIMKFKDTAKKGERTIFAILTDGDDTSSQRHNYNTVQAAIKEVQDAMKWEILFLGANMNAKNFASSVGIKLSNVAQFDATKKGMADAIGTMSFASSYIRGDAGTRTMANSLGAVGGAAGAAGDDIDITVAYNAMSTGKVKTDTKKDTKDPK